MLGCWLGTGGLLPAGLAASLAIGLTGATVLLPTRAGPLVAAAALGAAGIASGATAHRPPAASLLVDHPRTLAGPWQVRGALSRDPEVGGAHSTVDLRLDEVRVDGRWQQWTVRVRATVADPQPTVAWRSGDRFEAFLSLRSDRPPANPSLWRRDSLRASGAELRTNLKSFRQLRPRGRASGPTKWAADGRQRLRAAIRARFRRHQAVFLALFLGERGSVEADFTRSLARSGLIHLLAISGLHVGIALAAAYTAARTISLPRPVAAGVAGLALVGVEALVANRAPVRRAGLMAAAGLGGIVFGRRIRALDSMALAASYMVLRDPWVSRNLGFQLSVAATAGILLLAADLAGANNGRLRWARSLFAASTAAQVSVAPLLAAATYRLPMAGLLLNLMAVPLLAAALLAGAAALLIAALGSPPLGDLLAALAETCIDGLSGLGHLTDNLPFTRLAVPAGRAPLLWLLAVALFFGLRVKGQRRGACLVLATCGLLVAVHRPGPPAHLRLLVLDIGQGDALLVQPPASDPVVVDTGGSRGGNFDPGAAIIAPVLRAMGIVRLQAVAVSHLHSDHAGGVAGLLAEIPVRELWVGSFPPDAAAGGALVTAAGQVPILSLAGGHGRPQGPCRWKVLHPAGSWLRPGGMPISNDASLVLGLRCTEASVLLTGDVEADAEADWTKAQAATGFRGAVLKVPHHGSSTSSSVTLLTRMAPRRAVISVGWHNRFGLPKAEVLARYRQRGIALYRTDRDGAVTVTMGQRIRVRGERWTHGRGNKSIGGWLR